MTRAIGLLLAAPLGGFLLEALLGAGAFRLPLRAWGGTAAAAGCALFVSLLLGLPAGLALAHTRRNWPRILTAIPLVLPPAVAAAAWLGAGLPAPDSGGECGFLLGAIYWPVIALLLEASLRRLPSGAMDAARLHLTPARTILAVVWPHVRPSLAAGSMVVALLAASEFTVPATFAAPTIATVIYEEMSAFRFASAAAAALPLGAIAAPAAWAVRRVPVLPASRAGRPFLAGGPLVLARIGAGVAWTLTGVAPLAVFAARARGSAIVMNLDALGWSAALAAAAAALLVAWAAAGRGRSALEPLWMASLVLPGVVAAYGALALAGRLGLHPALGPSGALLLLALLARFAFVAWLPLREEPVERSQREAAELAGLSPARIWWRIVRPALVPRALAAGAIVFALALGEVGPAVLLSPPGRQGAAQRLFNWMHYGYDETVAAMALALFGAAALAAWGGLHAGRRADAGLAD